ncbi:penicillin-binding protein [Lysinibacillus sp. 2017]|uniref:penicillin-binding transpeptidase domain-containing protein n=1 Tax=unclassified Lysinibacillus TaxID=2636778 RepID=UPI000D525DA6|nr:MULTISPECIES: penicillin-binding transpeptidase domain-containing protein [unclassified Lysinibacillus]AWE06578.1 penicillin-binding protein [Lysinibacillus sp. 2017]TGN35385.1 PASTA domain-containing protein [Lysinibacillus sp. S2017]
MFILFGGLFLLLYWRFVSIQATGVVKGHELEAEALAKYQSGYVLSADRGKIFDRNANVIAEDTLSYRLVAVIRESATENPKKPIHVVDKTETARQLAQYIPMDEEKILELLTPAEGTDPYQVEFGLAGRGISNEVKKQIEALNLPGIILFSDKKRYYPNGSFASHLIGFAVRETEKDGSSEVVGKMGLESIYDDQLTGEDGKLMYQRDAKNYLLPSSDKVVQDAQDGNDIYLTIDKTVQNFLEDAMSRVNSKYNPQAMIGVVADPKTGEILAMSQRPTFNPDTREGLDGNWLNDVIENTIEPGSTMKTFTVAAAMDSGNWHPNAWYKSGSYNVYENTIRDHNTYGWGTITYLEGFQRSSNTAMTNLLDIMGWDTLEKYLDRFGFGQKSGIDLPGEASGVINSHYPLEKYTTTFGQGSTVTPIQLIQGLTAIANDGKMMQPFVIDKIVNSNTGEVVLDSEPTKKGQPITAETAKAMRELLASTVYGEKGNAKRFQIEGYEVAGKTGTAQMPKVSGAGYDWGKNEFLYSFLGMAPVDDPQLIVYIAVAKPKLGATEAGSDPVSQVFNSVVQNSLKYMNINPTDVAEVQKKAIPNMVGQQTDSVMTELEGDGLHPILIGEGGEILEQFPKANSSLIKGGIVFLKTDGDISLPSFENWSLRNMLVYKTLTKLPIELFGEGYVESQSVSQGTIVSDQSPIVVKLKTPQEHYLTPPAEDMEEGESEVENEEEALPQD